jgi:hypothetical protein
VGFFMDVPFRRWGCGDMGSGSEQRSSSAQDGTARDRRSGQVKDARSRGADVERDAASLPGGSAGALQLALLVLTAHALGSAAAGFLLRHVDSF